jgi:NADH-quinone oxidoreductase subunit N
VLSVGMTLAMLSLTGIPPLVGFIGKYTVFISAINSGWLWLVLIAILGSMVSIFFYFRPIINMWFKSSEFEGKLVIVPTLLFVVIISVLLMIVVPVFTNLFMSYSL